jgi:5-formyltetrahydrofolate cyclo-ligase
VTTDATESIAAQKARLRTWMRGQLKGVGPEEQRAASTRAGERLRTDEVWRAARMVGFFVPLPEEVDVWPWMIAALECGKEVCVPGFDPQRGVYGMRQVVHPGRDLVEGRYRVMEPAGYCAEVELNRLDLILVPGLAFDVRGFRLGRGKGYFDRLLRGVPAKRCGVAFDQQIVDRIPLEPHDEIMTFILTPTRWIRIGESRRVVA